MGITNPDLPQNPETQQDLLEQLLAGAAQREARKVAEEQLQKGSVTKAEFSSALGEFKQTMLAELAGLLQQKATSPEQTQDTDQEEEEPEPIQKAGRKGTIPPAQDPRDANPLQYLLQKARSGGDYDETDKQIIWALTVRGLTAGMSTADVDGEDFGDR